MKPKKKIKIVVEETVNDWLENQGEYNLPHLNTHGWLVSKKQSRELIRKLYKNVRNSLRSEIIELARLKQKYKNETVLDLTDDEVKYILFFDGRCRTNGIRF